MLVEYRVVLSSYVLCNNNILFFIGIRPTFFIALFRRALPDMSDILIFVLKRRIALLIPVFPTN